MLPEIPAIISLILFLAFLVLLLYLLLHGQHRRLLTVKLATSIVLGHVPLAIFNHPASIQLSFRKRALTPAACWIMSFIGCFTETIIPYTLLMFTIERLMYIRNPTGHAQRITRAGAITLIVFPWVISSSLAVVDVGVLSESVHVAQTYENISYFFCYTSYKSHQIRVVNGILRNLLGGAIPLLMSLVITITVLVMWCCYKRKMSLGRDFSLMGEEIEATVRNSVIAVAVLNALYIPIFITEAALGGFIRLKFAFLSVFGIIEGIVWICTLEAVREKFVSLFRRCCPTKLREVPVQYNTDDTNGSHDAL